MLKRVCFVLLTSLLCLQLAAQKKWKDAYYVELTDETFRDFKGFNQPIDIKKIQYKLLNAAVFFSTNEARLEQGLSALSFQENLEIMAWNHSIRMGEDDFFAHEDPKNRKRKTPRQRANLAGITNPQIAENLTAIGGKNYGTYMELADALVDSWIDSPPHRKTLYSADALQLGCGVYYYDGVWQKNRDIHKQGNGFWLATQNFQLFTKVSASSSKEKKPK